MWADGRCSTSVVQAGDEGRYGQQALEEWRQASYEDPDGAQIHFPQPLPLVAVEDREVQNILAGDDQMLFDQIRDRLTAKPTQAKMQGGIQAAWGSRHVRTSTGLSVTYQQSQFAEWFSLDSLIVRGFAKRRLSKPEERDGLWRETLRYYEAMQTTGRDVGPQTQVILAPSLAEGMLGQFVLPNFSGDRVIEGQSAFSRESFLAHKPVFHPDFSLLVDPLLPYELGSYLLTAEGVPAQRTTLVQEGILQTPFLRVKDAVRWGAEPTGVPQGTAGLCLRHKAEIPWPEVLKGIEDGVLVLSALGLHAQDSVSGSYSLSAPHSLRILNGQIVGKTDIKLTGNFLADLAAATTKTAASELDSCPYLILRTGVQSL